MFYLLLALFVYVAFALKNGKIIKTTIGNELVIPNQKQEQKISWLAVVVLILVAGLRSHSVGGDLGNYRINFDNVGEFHNINDGYDYYGFFFQIINWTCSLFGTDNLAYTIFLLVLSAINVLVMVFAVKHLSADISTTMFLYVCLDVYVPALSMLRQGTAVVFVVLSLKFIYEKNLVRFLTCILVAACFHESAIILLPIYLFSFMTGKPKDLIVYTIGVVAILIFGVFDKQIVYGICTIFNFHYYNSYKMEGDPLSLASYLKSFAMIIVFIFFLGYQTYKWVKHKPTSKKYTLLLNVFFVSALINFYNIVQGEFDIVSRMTYYFSTTLILLVPQFLKEITNKKIKTFFTIAVICAGLIYLTTTVLLRDQFDVLPYKIFWS